MYREALWGCVMRAKPRFDGHTKMPFAAAMGWLKDEWTEGHAAIQGYVRELRAECAAARVKVKEREKEIAYLEGRLDALEGLE